MVEYRKNNKDWPIIIGIDTDRSQGLFNFLSFQSMAQSTQWNQLGAPVMAYAYCWLNYLVISYRQMDQTCINY